jgi:heme exporter protein D
MTPEALSAGRYAAYIWPAYAVSVAGFAWMIIDTLARARRWKARAAQLEGETGSPQDQSAKRGTEAEPGSRSNVSVQGSA